MLDYRETLRNIVYGVAVGDAMGVPFEFKTRDEMRKNPCVEMTGFGTHGQPKGTWSDDTSLTLCLLAGLHIKQEQMDIKGIVTNMIKWYDYGEFTPMYERFDCGNAVASAIERMKEGIPFFECGGNGEMDNGNGSLMRVAPLCLYVARENDINLRYNIVRNISSLTHRHEISILGCFIYVELLYNILKDKDNGVLKAKQEYIFQTAKELVDNHYINRAYDMFLMADIVNIWDDNLISSTGYVVDTLNAAVYSFLTTDNYTDCILKAVNLGGDTDTVAAVAGGLAGLYYDGVPQEWLDDLENVDMIERYIRSSTV